MQIRVQLAQRGASLLGDSLYNSAALVEAEADAVAPVRPLLRPHPAPVLRIMQGSAVSNQTLRA